MSLIADRLPFQGPREPGKGNLLASKPLRLNVLRTASLDTTVAWQLPYKLSRTFLSPGNSVAANPIRVDGGTY
jgi:hypothetical protein